MLEDLLKQRTGSRLEVFRVFMYRERKERSERTSSQAEREDWEDAGNVYVGVFLFPGESVLRSGRDREMVQRELVAFELGANPSRLEKARILAAVYLAVRGCLYPELEMDQAAGENLPPA